MLDICDRSPAAYVRGRHRQADSAASFRNAPLPKRGLADVEVQDVVGCLVLEQFFERVLDHALGEDVGRVVGRRFLAVPPGQAIDKAALRMVD